MQMETLFSIKSNKQNQKRVRNALKDTDPEKLGGEHRKCNCTLANEQIEGEACVVARRRSHTGNAPTATGKTQFYRPVQLPAKLSDESTEK